MIYSIQDLAVTRERVSRLEIERMQGEILDYLVDGARRLPANAIA